MRKGPLAAVAAVLALALIWVGFLWAPVPERVSGQGVLDLAAPPEGGDFVLESALGPVGLAEVRGRVVLIYFGYTWCPDICPTNLAFVGQALESLTPTELAQVQVLFVSVDPARDTPERLVEYTAYFHPSILGVTGSPEAVERVARQYGAAYRIADQAVSGGYLVDHSGFTYLVEPGGRLVETLDHATSPPRIAEAIRRWLSTGG